MSNTPFFLNFPIINYSGFSSTNIMERVAFAKKFKDNAQLFSDYVVPDGKRAEQVALDAYGDPNRVWIVYLFNDIVDPYYQWPLSTHQFNRFIFDKYSSYINASQQIQYWQNNWPSDDTHLDVNSYAGLASNLKKYWRPVILPGNYVSYYVRKSADTTINTNQVVTLTTTGTFTLNEYVTQNDASGQVQYSDGTTTILINVQGTFTNTALIGSADAVSGIVSASSIQYVIPLTEQEYFSPITALQYEQQLNNNKANIRLLKQQFVGGIEQSLKAAYAGG